MSWELRSDRFASMTAVAPSPGVSEGQPAKINDVVGFFPVALNAGVSGAFIYRAEKIMVDKTSVSGVNAPQAGQKVYYDNSASLVTTHASGNTLIGRCLISALPTDAQVMIDLDGACQG